MIMMKRKNFKKRGRKGKRKGGGKKGKDVFVSETTNTRRQVRKRKKKGGRGREGVKR